MDMSNYVYDKSSVGAFHNLLKQLNHSLKLALNKC